MEVGSRKLSTVVIIILVLIGALFKLFNLYSHYKNAEEGLDEQCLQKDITDENSIKEYKHQYWRKSFGTTVRVLGYISIPILVLFLYVWFLKR